MKVLKKFCTNQKLKSTTYSNHQKTLQKHKKVKFSFSYLGPIKGSAIDGITNLESSKGGASQPLSAAWPVIVGIIILCVVVVIIGIAMYKTGAYKKLRFFKPEEQESPGGGKDPLQ